MIELTNEQRQAIARGEPVHVCDQGQDLVLLREDQFQKLKSDDYDDSTWSDEERDLAREEAVELLDRGKP